MAPASHSLSSLLLLLLHSPSCVPPVSRYLPLYSNTCALPSCLAGYTLLPPLESLSFVSEFYCSFFLFCLLVNLWMLGLKTFTCQSATPVVRYLCGTGNSHTSYSYSNTTEPLKSRKNLVFFSNACKLICFSASFSSEQLISDQLFVSRHTMDSVA